MKRNADHTRSYIPLSAGTMVSHYRILGKIGAGGMGEVYLAEDIELDRKVAMKFLPSHLLPDDDIRKRFIREARTLARLNHPNIVSVHEVGKFDGRPYYVMELVDGKSLYDLARDILIPLDQIIDYATQICAGLAEAHQNGIIHRDIKPANIIVDGNGRVRIVDFGLAAVTGDDRLTVTGSTLGTLSYMSPEQLQGGQIGPQSDIFSVGIVLYELTCGNHPFSKSSSAEAAARILRDEPADVRDLRPDAPYDLVRIIGRCLKKDVSRRFQSARELQNELLDLVENKTGISPDRKQSSDQSGPRKRLQEKKFTLTAELVRRLSVKSPKMIGDGMTYLDNEIESEILIIYLHAWGIDHRHTREFMTSLPYRAMSPTLYGFDRSSSNRPPLTLEDQSELLRSFFADIVSRLRPAKIILMGFSAGADHALHLATSTRGPGIPLTGLLSFGCNVNLESCFMSSWFSELKNGNPEELLENIKRIGNGTRTMEEWLKIHEYMIDVFSKFGENADPLRSFAKGIVEPFKKSDWKQFVHWYRKAIEVIPHVRFIIDSDDFTKIDEILARHLESNVLGNDFREDSIVREHVSHMELSGVEKLQKHTNDFIRQIVS